MSRGNIKEFLLALFESEGGGDLQAVNKFGYLGKYQFGEDALIDIGYYKGDPSKNKVSSGKFKYDWIGDWTGKNGATSKDEFLASDSIQNMAAKDWIDLLCKRLKKYKLQKYIGETVGGVNVTESGVIAAAHLKGFGNAKHSGVIQFLSSNGQIDAADANGTRVSKYMEKFANYDMGCCQHLTIKLLDREKDPIAGLQYEIKSGKKTIRKGKTDDQGHTKKIVLQEQAAIFTVFVHRVEGGLKQIAEIVSPIKSAFATLTSPKIKIQSELESHKGTPGAYQSGKVKKKASKLKETKKIKMRGSKGNPVVVIESGGVKIGYSPSVTKSLSSKSVSIIEEILLASGNNYCLVTSTYRDPANQARVMYENISKGKIIAYNPMYGGKVTTLCLQKIKEGKSRDEVISNMSDKIIEIGPANVSKHLADPIIDKLQTVDISPKSISDQDAFEIKAKNYVTSGMLRNFLSPNNGDPAFHLEINQ